MYNYNNIKYNIKVKNAYKINYFCTTGTYRKLFSFTGLCISVSKKHKSFILRNFIFGENVEITFNFDNPFILSIEHLKNYSFKYSKSKIFFKKKMQIKQQPKMKKKLLSDIFIFKKNIFKKILVPSNFLLKTYEKNLKIRQIRNKFRL